MKCWCLEHLHRLPGEIHRQQYEIMDAVAAWNAEMDSRSPKREATSFEELLREREALQSLR